MTEPTLDPATDYPLSVHRRDLLFTPNGKSIEDITIDAVVAGDIQATDLRITPDTLRLQAQISERVGRPQLGANLRRAAEMTAISDERVLQIYNALRPNASSKSELDSIADELTTQYNATHLADLVREAADVYERRDLLAKSE
ncbi:diol dehydratase small subunit [Mycolicibacterium fluoranthenivorans]|jgi:propanediol dehydratase small subunit|uniref:Diol dehydratase small subunit n=1 Tax=Mycolicibacterium fluoranthenivorans TaxID=258505 RepID=A0A1G4WWG6_9MYCO|nr:MULTISPECIES: diol dehydratase small subunit [Mycobacteriaceae]MCV7252363.1 diol dehydratase small subunit [Mycobacterium hackensackense]MCV7353926.1 diol dehydratase small subunit [Mycolicibacterium fluoranthenivorans]NIH94472.1 propanediol dehydratase small subunit [Mycolicibacterium fluoranthenivorans]QNJ94673.1 diol dehydratase small subunit [Mycolicibacterium fluoranthenivorans]SCX31100.1 propanediol dehydratase small subunit [Mycolicibacterium fluoranthenivorans]